MIKVRKQTKEEKASIGKEFPVTIVIGDVKKHLTKESFYDLRNKVMYYTVEKNDDNLIKPIILGYDRWLNQGNFTAKDESERMVDMYLKTMF